VPKLNPKPMEQAYIIRQKGRKQRSVRPAMPQSISRTSTWVQITGYLS